MEQREPLAVAHVDLALRDVVQLTGVDDSVQDGSGAARGKRSAVSSWRAYLALRPSAAWRVRGSFAWNHRPALIARWAAWMGMEWPLP